MDVGRGLFQAFPLLEAFRSSLCVIQVSVATWRILREFLEKIAARHNTVMAGTFETIRPGGRASLLRHR